MLQQTQNHLNRLGIACPPQGGDQRHVESASYPFMDYDVLSEEGDDQLGMLICHTFHQNAYDKIRNP
jgi:hypothetical protein